MEVAYFGMEGSLNSGDPYGIEGPVTEDSDVCAVCKMAMGRWGRRQCDLCKRSVCDTCSPSSIIVSDQVSVGRACNQCASISSRAPVLRQRLDLLAGQLSSIAGNKAHPIQQKGCAALELEEVLGSCEAAVTPLQDLAKRLASAEARATRAEAAAALNAQSLRRLEERMHSSSTEMLDLARQVEATLSPDQGCSSPPPEGSLDDAIAILRGLLTGGRLDAAAASLAAGSRGKSEETSARSEASDEWCKVQQNELPRELQELSLSECSVDEAARVACATFDLEELECGQEEQAGAETGAWQENSKSCAECGVPLRSGALTLMNAWRHHCRVCGRNVCASCSPSLIQLSSQPTPQRVCTPCAHNAECGPALTRRLVQLGVLLHRMGGLPARVSSHTLNLEGAVEFCEAAGSLIQAGGGGTPSKPSSVPVSDFLTRTRSISAAGGSGNDALRPDEPGLHEASSMDWLAADQAAASSMEERIASGACAENGMLDQD
mmetsp:Transcript_31878/g.74541  ORF Transcript_31878/g.74541 Transcript_31878/m.74541 type:complete len:492 (+) Transcript_31878:56-1531(+)